jgi:hypothetical protein
VTFEDAIFDFIRYRKPVTKSELLNSDVVADGGKLRSEGVVDGWVDGKKRPHQHPKFDGSLLRRRCTDSRKGCYRVECVEEKVWM